jgi:PAS domain S-box-containing protein
MCLLWGPDLLVLFNNACTPLAGGGAKALGQPAAKVFDSVWSALQPHIRQALAGTGTVVPQVRMPAGAEGQVREISWILSPVPTDSGNPGGKGGMAGVLCTLIDVPARSPAGNEEALARLAAIVENSEDAIVSKSLEGIVQTWNIGAEHMFGYPAAEMVGKPISILIPADRLREEDEILARLRAGETIRHYETVRVTRDGRRLDVSVTISPLRDASGRVIGASTILRDITEKKQAEAQMRRAREAAEEANKAKDHILSVVSHELRTPLNPILAITSFLQNRVDMPESLREDLETIRRNVEQEARIVDDLLQLTRLQRGKVVLHQEVVDLHAVLHAVLAQFQPQFDTKRLAVSVALAAGSHHVWADPGRMQQAFSNLIDNAVKFTPEGGRVTIRTLAAGGGQVRAEIADTGVGIDADVLPRLFDSFVQGETTLARQYGGLGLGLVIVKRIVDLHNGTIQAASDGRGRGATFSLELPALTSTSLAGPKPPPPGRGVAAKRILLVEDHPDTMRVMNRLLKSLGYTVLTAATVADAIAKIEQEEFDVLVSDIGLPDGSGLDVMRALRARRNTKGIALSGFGHDDDIRRSREAGFVEHLVKPVNFQLLDTTLRRIC